MMPHNRDELRISTLNFSYLSTALVAWASVVGWPGHTYPKFDLEGTTHVLSTPPCFWLRRNDIMMRSTLTGKNSEFIPVQGCICREGQGFNPFGKNGLNPA